MEPVSLTQTPFAALTFIAAPALLTNATSVLALSTTNRMLRTRERMRELFAKSQAGQIHESDAQRLVDHVNRVEMQSVLLLEALRAIYLALSSFAGATLVTLLGATLMPYQGAFWFHGLAVLGLVLGIAGVFCLVLGSLRLFQATRLSLIDIRQEATIIRHRMEELVKGVSPV